MAVGYLLPEIKTVQATSRLSTVQPSSPWGGFTASLPLRSGAKTDTQPISDEPRETKVGYMASGFGMLDWYNRIHFSTLSIDIGTVVSDQTRDILVWNAYLEPRTLNTITAYNADGINISQPAAPPLVYTPLREHTYTLSIITDGPATIDARYVFDFDIDDFTLSIIGRRVIPWTWRPDWGGPMIERMEWATNVITAYDGTEQRIKLRGTPRRAWEFSFAAEGRQRRRLDAALYGWGARIFALPIWVDGAPLAAQAAAGAVSLSVATADRDYHATGMAILLSEAGDYEVAEIDTVGSGVLNLLRPLSVTWPAATMVYPVRQARLPDSHGISRFTGDYVYGRVRLDSEDETSDWAAASETLYRSHPVLLTRPNWISDVDMDFERKLSVLDYGVGKRSVTDESGRPEIVQSYRWLLTTKAELAAFRSWLYSRAGKHVAMWVPTWAYDILPVATIASNATTWDVENIGYTALVEAGMHRRDIRIQLKSGAIYYRRITGAAKISASVERLTIDASLGVDVAVADVEMISFMAICRLDTDVVELAYFSGDSAECAHSVRAIGYDV